MFGEKSVVALSERLRKPIVTNKIWYVPPATKLRSIMQDRELCGWFIENDVH